VNIASLENKLREETGSDWTIGISTLLSPYNPVKGVNELLEADLNLGRIEIALVRQLENEDRVVEKLVELGKKHDMLYSVHTPFLYDDLAHPKKRVRGVYVDEGKKAIDFAASIEASRVVFHPGEFFFRQNLPPLELFEPFKKSRRSYLKRSLKSLRKLSTHGSSRGVKLLIENLPHGLCNRSEDLEYLLSRVENSNFIMDIGHANVSDSFEELIELKPRYFHFNDNNGEVDDHRPLGEGNIDLSFLMTQLKGYGGDKTIIFELYSLEDVLASLEVFENILHRT